MSTSPVARGLVRPHVNASRIIAPITLFAIGALFLILTPVMNPVWFGPADSVTGSITSLDWNDHPTVSYEVAGTSYEMTSSYHSGSLTVGQSFDLVYNPADPTQAGTSGTRVGSFVFLGLGLAAAIACVILVIRLIVKYHSARSLLDHGRRIDAAVVDVTQNQNVHLRQKLLTTVTCEWESRDRVKHSAKSDGFFAASPLALHDLGLTTLPVYVDPREAGSCYVDVSSLTRRGRS